MTKLEQCLRVMHAIDEDSRIVIGFIRTLRTEQNETIQETKEPLGFEVAALDGDDEDIAVGAGDTPDEAIDELHKLLAAFVVRMRSATEVYDG